MSRWRAFTYHFLLSIAVLGAIAAIVVSVWYPPELFRLASFGRLILIISIVHIVVGPIITLIIFRSDKPGVKFDLTFIATLQLALLAWGIHALIGNRPAFVVWVGDRYEVVAAREILPEDLALAPPQFWSVSWTGPTYVAVVPPDDPSLQQTLLLEALQGKDLHLQPRYFRPLSSVPAAERARAEALDLLLPLLTPEERSEYARAAAGRPTASLRYLPVTNAEREAGIMLVDALSGDPLGVADLDPWAVRARSGGDKL